MAEIDLPFGMGQNSEEFLPNFDKVPELSDASYNNIDVLVTARAGKKLEKEGALAASLFDQALLGPSLTCSLRGMRIDHGKIAQAKLDIEAKAREGKEKFLALAGNDVKFGKGYKPSPAELARILYRDFKVKTRLGKTDNPSVAADILVDIRDDPKTPDAALPIVELALELTALESDRMALEKPAGADGRIHSSFMVSAAVSARWGSRKDAFNEGMNLHSASDLIRKVFIPDPGMVMVALDQSQAESNLVAALSGSKWYLDAHKAGNTHVQAGKVFFPEHAEYFTKDWAKNTPYPASPGKTFYDLAKSCQHACCDGDTEILLETGWVKMSEYDGESPIAVWGQTGEIFWESPTYWHVSEFFGDMEHITGRRIDLFCTPNHRIPNATHGKLYETVAENYHKNLGNFPVGGNLMSGTSQVSVVEAKLLAATWSDGYLNKRQVKTDFNIRKDRKIERLKELLTEAGEDFYINGPYDYTNGREKPGYLFVVRRHLRKSLGWDMLQWSFESRRAFLDELEFWDGCRDTEHSFGVTNTDLEGLRIIQTLAKLTGLNAHLHIGKVGSSKAKTWYRLIITQAFKDVSGTGSPCASWSACDTLKVPYEGRVYCPTTSTSWFLARRNGHIYVTGNSNYHQSAAGMAKHLHIPKADAQRIQTNYFKKVPEIPQYHQWVANEIRTKRRLVTPFGRVRQFLGRTWETSTVREAISYQPQSTVSDITKIFLWRLFKYLDPKDLQILMEHHDSVMFQVKESELERVMPLVHELSYIPFKVGSETIASKWEAKVGYSWAEI